MALALRVNDLSVEKTLGGHHGCWGFSAIGKCKERMLSNGRKGLLRYVWDSPEVWM